MSGKIRKKRIKEKSARLIFCIALYAVLALFIALLFVFNSNYTKIYKSPQVKDGKVDFYGTDISSRNVACNLGGEWEFFYNKWIVTDNENCAADGMIKLPDLWTYKNYGSGRLPKTGYASYRLYAENVQPEINLIVYHHYGNFAYRVFVNGQLNYRCGFLSKNLKETRITCNTDEIHPYNTGGEPIEIVIEVSASDKGGFNAAPWLAATVTGNSYGNNLRAFNYISIGITSAAVIISLISFAFFKFRRDITVPLFMLALYAHFLSSKDLFYVLGLQISAAIVFEFVSALFSFALFVFHLYKSGAGFKKIPVIALSAACLTFSSLLFAFYGTPLAPLFAFLLFAAMCLCLIPLIFNRNFNPLQYVVYGILFTFLMSVFFFELSDWLGLLVFGTEFIFTAELMVIIGCFAVLWLWKLAVTTHKAMRAGELELKLSALQNQALKAQIKPHFIYNSLTAIQSQYREGLNKGDKAIEQFAAHLRLVTDSNGDDMIPFDSEVRNVLNYFELENLRAGGNLNLLLDIGYSDFSVPVLSLQPLVENAIRHGGLREKQDGYITLSSEKISSAVNIVISDNGKGFDVNSVRTGVGLENTKKRFELMNAVMTVESSTGVGTRVKIEIPLE